MLHLAAPPSMSEHRPPSFPQVHRSVTLHLSPAALDFGDVPLFPAHPPPAALSLTAALSSHARTLTISNTARGSRAVSVSAAPVLLLPDGEPCPTLSLAVAMRLDRCTSEGAEELLKMERDRSELAETLQRKLRIAERKGRADKVAKWRAKLERLQASLVEAAYPSDLESDTSDWGGNSETESEAEGVSRRSLVRAKSSAAGGAPGGGELWGWALGRLGRAGASFLSVWVRMGRRRWLWLWLCWRGRQASHPQPAWRCGVFFW
jgi:hypothetical protein